MKSKNKPAEQKTPEACGYSGGCSCCHHEENHGVTHSHGEHGSEKSTAIVQIIVAAVLAVLGYLSSRFLADTAFVQVLFYVAAVFTAGWQAIFSALRGIFRGYFFDENFLMSLAAICALIIREYPEAAAVMILFKIGELLEEGAVAKSRGNVAKLMDIRPDTAVVLRGGVQETVSPKDVAAGEKIVIAPGGKIPLDCEVTEGESTADTSSMTGESAPVPVSRGSQLMSGTVNVSGLITAVVTKPYGEDSASRVLKLVTEASDRKSRPENFITKFSKIYTPAVCGAALLTAVVPPLFFGADLQEFVGRALVFLVCSCPCALVISVPLSFFGGIGRGAKEGFLIKGSAFFEPLANLTTLLLDKTGTITKGRFEVTDIKCANGNEERLLESAAAVLAQSTHPLAQAVATRFSGAKSVTEMKEHHGKGVTATLSGGAKVTAGSERLLRENGIDVTLKAEGTAVYVAESGVYLGYIAVSDTIKETSAKAIQTLRDLGVKNIAMLTGDNKSAAASVAAAAGITEVHGELLPEGKLNILREYKSKSKKGAYTAFAGDGINDAPVLTESDIGIAMGGIGSDIAIESADMVVMNDDLNVIAKGIVTARRTRTVVMQNIVFALAVKFTVQILGLLGIATMWMAVFADVGVTVLAILNAASIFAAPKQKT